MWGRTALLNAAPNTLHGPVALDLDGPQLAQRPLEFGHQVLELIADRSLIALGQGTRLLMHLVEEVANAFHLLRVL
jgi:hypothetical protein